MNRKSGGSVLMVPAERVWRFNQLSSRTTLRCEEALTLFRSGDFSHLLLSGGIFEPWQTVAAADIMRAWFLDRRVPYAQILVERNSVDTFQNVEFGLCVLKSAGLEGASIHVISESHHAFRIGITFWRAYRRRVMRHAIKAYRLNAKEWLVEWLFILTHLLDPRGRYLPWIKWNRRRRARREQSQ